MKKEGQGEKWLVYNHGEEKPPKDSEVEVVTSPTGDSDILAQMPKKITKKWVEVSAMKEERKDISICGSWNCTGETGLREYEESH